MFAIIVVLLLSATVVNAEFCIHSEQEALNAAVQGLLQWSTAIDPLVAPPCNQALIAQTYVDFFTPDAVYSGQPISPDDLAAGTVGFCSTLTGTYSTDFGTPSLVDFTCNTATIKAAGTWLVDGQVYGEPWGYEASITASCDEGVEKRKGKKGKKEKCTPTLLISMFNPGIPVWEFEESCIISSEEEALVAVVEGLSQWSTAIDPLVSPPCNQALIAQTYVDYFTPDAVYFYQPIFPPDLAASTVEFCNALTGVYSTDFGSPYIVAIDCNTATVHGSGSWLVDGQPFGEPWGYEASVVVSCDIDQVKRNKGKGNNNKGKGKNGDPVTGKKSGSKSKHGKGKGKEKEKEECSQTLLISAFNPGIEV